MAEWRRLCGESCSHAPIPALRARRRTRSHRWPWQSRLPVAVAALATHDDVDKVAFTGSTEVGRLIVQAVAGNLKKVTLELGGKSPNIVFDDAEAGAVNAIFFNHGQCCVASFRLFVQEDRFDEVVNGVAEIAKGHQVRPGHGSGTQMGPQVSDEQLCRVTGFLQSGVSEDAIGGRLDIMTGASGRAGPHAGREWRWDVALSFAGAQRNYVGQVAAGLKARGVRCFYDADRQVRLWGTHLAEELPRIYERESAVVVVFVSADYAEGDWTRLERRAAFSWAVRKAGVYVLPARFDDSELPGLLEDVVAINLHDYNPGQFADLWWPSSPISVSARHHHRSRLAGGRWCDASCACGTCVIPWWPECTGRCQPGRESNRSRRSWHGTRRRPWWACWG